MNIQNFYEYVILRDILAYLFPGGIALTGITIILQAINNNRWSKFLSLDLLGDYKPWFIIPVLIFISFLLGHLIDMVYRFLFQNRAWYRRPKTILKMLTGSAQLKECGADSDPLTCGIREAIGQFFNVNWKEITPQEAVSSGKAFYWNNTLGYWIEEEDPKLFSTEVGRPVVQAHFLHASGLSFFLFGICILISEIIRIIRLSHSIPSDLLFSGLSVLFIWGVGYLLILQGGHKRDIIIEHTFRSFYALWQHKYLDQTRSQRNEDDKKTSASSSFKEIFSITFWRLEFSAKLKKAAETDGKR